MDIQPQNIIMGIQPQNIINHPSLPRNLGGGHPENREGGPGRAPQNQAAGQDIYNQPGQQRAILLDDFQHREDGNM